MCLLVKLPGCSDSELLRVSLEEAERVGDVKDAIIAKFKQHLAGVDPVQLKLFKLEGCNSVKLLDPTQTLSAARICADTTLLVRFASPGNRARLQLWDST